MDIPGYDAWKLASPPEYDEPDDCCPNCGGEGVVYDCMTEYACIDPEGGCDLCERRCDWCQGRKANQPDPDHLRDLRAEDERMARDYPDNGDDF